MHGRYDAIAGKRVAAAVEPFRLLWLEEPVPAENIDAMRDIRASTRTPICCGENIFLRHGFVPLLEKHAADIIMPDIQKVGGLLEARKIADMAHAYYVPFAPHCVVSPIGSMGSVHVCAAVPNFLVLEWHWINNLDYWKNFVKEGEIIQRGFIPVPFANTACVWSRSASRFNACKKPIRKNGGIFSARLNASCGWALMIQKP